MSSRILPILTLLAALTGPLESQARESAPWKFERARVFRSDKTMLDVQAVVISGDSVKYSYESKSYDGRAGSLRTEGVLIHQVRRLNVPDGNRARRGALIGAAVTGGLIGTLLVLDAAGDNVGVEANLTGVVFFTMAGAGFGGLIGAAVDTWQTVFHFGIEE